MAYDKKKQKLKESPPQAAGGRGKQRTDNRQKQQAAGGRGKQRTDNRQKQQASVPVK
jgi:hypothetical protein